MIGGKKQLLRVLNSGLHSIKVPKGELEGYLDDTSYFDYLKNVLGVDDPGVLRMARNSGLDWASTGADLMSIRAAKDCGAMGFSPVSVYDEENPYIHHFPDGNAGVARALVKKMIPKVGKGKNAEELLLSRFDYSELDQSGNAVRIRLNSTVIEVRHGGAPKDSSEVFVTYIQGDRPFRVKAGVVVLACHNKMIPHIVPDLPKTQASALRLQERSPLQYTTVGLRNWRAMKERGIGLAMSPGNIAPGSFYGFPGKYGGLSIHEVTG